MIEKVHYQDDQEELYQACAGMMTRLVDMNARVKSACSEAIPRHVLSQYAPDSKHFMVHAVIMGDGESYGQNRNGDFWSKLACVTYHPTFVSHGAYFREHNHRSKDLAIGQIKYAAHNEKMARTELLLWGNIKKAEDIYEALKSGKSRSHSMSARVPYDRCNVCDHKAASPDKYCKHASRMMNQWVPEMKKYAYVHNDHPTFFDASDVANPADRIAHYLTYRLADEGMRKAASAGSLIIPGSEWAAFNQLALPQHAQPALFLESGKLAQLRRLADKETWLDGALKQSFIMSSSPDRVAMVQDIAPHMLDGEFNDAQIKAARNIRPGTFFGELAKRGCLLPFHTFTAYAFNRPISDVQGDATVKRAAAFLPKVFRELLSNGCGCQTSDADMFDGASPGVITLDAGVDDPVRAVMDAADQKFSLAAAPMRHRVIRITIEKSGSCRPQFGDTQFPIDEAQQSKAVILAGMYGLYKLAAITAMRQFCPMKIDDRHELLIAGHNNFAAA